MVTHDNQNTEETDIENKREHPRKTCLESTLYATKKGVYEGVIKDIGAKGVFVATNEPIAVGEIITVAVPSSRNEKGIKLEGEIVWKDQYGIGVHFKRHLNE